MVPRLPMDFSRSASPLRVFELPNSAEPNDFADGLGLRAHTLFSELFPHRVR
jgi:hypothetical protein